MEHSCMGSLKWLWALWSAAGCISFSPLFITPQIGDGGPWWHQEYQEVSFLRPLCTREPHQAGTYGPKFAYSTWGIRQDAGGRPFNVRSLYVTYGSLKYACQHQQDKIAETLKPSSFSDLHRVRRFSRPCQCLHESHLRPICTHYIADVPCSDDKLCNSTLGQAKISMKKERSARPEKLVRAWEFFKAQIPGN